MENNNIGKSKKEDAANKKQTPENDLFSHKRIEDKQKGRTPDNSGKNADDKKQADLSWWRKFLEPGSLWQFITAVITAITLIWVVSSTNRQFRITEKSLIKSDSQTQVALNLTRRADSIAEQALIHSIRADYENGILAIKDTLARDRNVKKELRAYIGIKEIADFSIGNDNISWKIQASNTGKTPAYNLIAYAIFKRNGTGVYKSDINRLFEDDDVFSSQMKGNGLDFTMNFDSRRTKIKIDSTYIAGVISGKLTIYFYGCITYDDIFGDSHKTWFCYYTEPVGSDAIRFQIYNKYNDGD